MVDLSPHVYATLKATPYFAVGRSGFLDASGRFKVFRADESPTDETPFVTVEMRPGDESQITGWIKPYAAIAVYGKDTDWDDLFEIADTIRGIFHSSTAFAPVAAAPALLYQMIGSSDFEQGRDPVSENVTVAVALRFGIAL